MSTSYVSVSKQKQVRTRAKGACEYCLCPSDYALDAPYHVDHIIAEMHGGANTVDNLAYACPLCNGHKSCNLATYLPEEDLIVNLYHPRKDTWEIHFNLRDSGEIIGLTNIGRGTIRLLKLNLMESVELRRALLAIGFI